MEFSTKSTLAHTELINMHACIVRITSYVATPWYVGRAVSALLTYRFSKFSKDTFVRCVHLDVL